MQRQFYETIDREHLYTTECEAKEHPFHDLLCLFVERWKLADKKCLEIGSGKGLFQDLVLDYTGVDIAGSLQKYYHKKYITVSDARLPFSDCSFDAIFTYATHEHIPDIEKALEEITRILKPGGICLFAPAWHTRNWFTLGYQVRSYSDFDWRGKLVKFSIPFRNFVLFRWPLVFFKRLIHMSAYLMNRKPRPLRFKRLIPNYEIFWQSDSDACNSLDPFDVILWFKRRGFKCLGYDNLLSALFVRTTALELQKNLLMLLAFFTIIY